MNVKSDSQKGCIGVFLTLGAIGSAIVGIFGCLAVFGIKAPVLVPQPTPTSQAMAGEIRDVVLERYNTTFGDYRQERGWSITEFPADALNSPGVLVRFVASITGFKDQWCIMKWSIYDTNTQERKLMSTSNYELSLRPERESDTASDYIWVGYPLTTGRYFVRLELLDPDGVRLDYTDSPNFDVTIK